MFDRGTQWRPLRPVVRQHSEAEVLSWRRDREASNSRALSRTQRAEIAAPDASVQATLLSGSIGVSLRYLLGRREIVDRVEHCPQLIHFDVLFKVVAVSLLRVREQFVIEDETRIDGLEAFYDAFATGT